MKERVAGKMSTGEELHIITLENANGMKVEVTDMGGSLISVFAKDKAGALRDVTLGYDTVEGYEKNPYDFGAVIGRNANRIVPAKITINDVTYDLPGFHGKMNLHSRPDTFSYRKWNFETEKGDGEESCTFFINSPDGDQGFPGNMDVELTYTLTDENELMLQYYGLSDKDTVMNMTNHSFFNLNGEGNGSVLEHKVTIFADEITEVAGFGIPTGNNMPVQDTAFDFRTPKTVREGLEQNHPLIEASRGYDHNYVLHGGKRVEEAELAARVEADESGIVMEVYTDLPGMHFYLGNRPVYEHGKHGDYPTHCGLAFETQYAPNAVNIPAFESPIIKANEERVSLTVFRFFVNE